MFDPNTFNLAGLVLNSAAAILLVASAPVPQRVSYFGDVEQVPADQRKDRRTRIAYRWALWMLVAGFVLQLAAQLMR